MEIIHAKDETFSNELQADVPVLVDFYADWCGPCKMMAPVVEEVAKDESIKVGKINIYENQELAEKYGVESIPTIIVFKRGKEYKRQIGVTDKESLLNLLN